jgi:hypothetical protein
MRRRHLLSLGLCAVTAVVAVRGWAARPAAAATMTHVAVLAGAPGNAASQAEYRYLHSQPNHWRACVLKK